MLEFGWAEHVEPEVPECCHMCVLVSHEAPVGPQNSLYTTKPTTHRLTIQAMIANMTNANAVLSFSCIFSCLPSISADRDYSKDMMKTSSHTADL